MKAITIKFLLASLCLSAAFAVSGQDPTETPAGPAGQRPGGAPGASQDPQPYDRVITKDAKSKKGIFTVHQVKDKYYYEIPKDGNCCLRSGDVVQTACKGAARCCTNK